MSEVSDQASGTSIDYMQHQGVPYIYGVELRPAEDDQTYGFTIPARFIKPTGSFSSHLVLFLIGFFTTPVSGEEMLASFLALTEYIIETKKL